MPYVDGASILAQSGIGAPSAEDTAWADTVADAIESAIAARLGDTVPSAGQTDELERAALLDGIAGYADRDAPHGVMSLSADGQSTRLGRSLVRSLEPVLFSITGPGIG